MAGTKDVAAFRKELSGLGDELLVVSKRLAAFVDDFPNIKGTQDIPEEKKGEFSGLTHEHRIAVDNWLTGYNDLCAAYLTGSLDNAAFESTFVNEIDDLGEADGSVVAELLQEGRESRFLSFWKVWTRRNPNPVDHKKTELVLCLSGGGFRATVFHLGVVDYLVQARLLHRVRAIYAVSGGAVTASHLVHHWQKYLDAKTYPEAAVALLSLCRKGLIGPILLRNFVRGKGRSETMAELLEPELKSKAPTSAPDCYVISSSLGDTSQYALNLKNDVLYRLDPLGREAKAVCDSRASLSHAKAVAMSACFPIVFEPFPLNQKTTNLPFVHIRENLVADGGIIDNLGIVFAVRGELRRPAASGIDFVVCDAAQLFDDVSPTDLSKYASLVSPMRTIDYLMKANAESKLAQFTEDSPTGRNPRRLRGSRREHLFLLRLAGVEARSSGDPLFESPPARIVDPIVRTRTNFDQFSWDEIVSLYRCGILAAHAQLLPLGGTALRGEGLISEESVGFLRRFSLNVPWNKIKINQPSRSLGETLAEMAIRRPASLFILLSIVLFFASYGALMLLSPLMRRWGLL